MINLEKYKAYKSITLWMFKCFVFFLLIVMPYAFCINKDLILTFISSIAGFTAFLIPEIVFIYYANRRKDSQLTTELVVYDAIIALLYKYSLIILILGFLLKFTQFYKVVIIFAFCFGIISKIVLYLKSPNM